MMSLDYLTQMKLELGADFTEKASVDLNEAYSAILNDEWDLRAWESLLMITSAQGQMDVHAIILRWYALKYFPRSALAIRRLADFQIANGDLQAGCALLAERCRQCFSPPLWEYYLEVLVTNFRKGSLTVPNSKEEQMTFILSEFEVALDAVGLSLYATGLWQAYLDFLKTLPDSSSLEASKKLHSIRRVYHRCLLAGVDSPDRFMADFESFERIQQALDSNALEQYLEDWRKKFLHTKSVVADRRKFADNIDFSRLAQPPVQSLEEAQQLQLWSNWIGHESLRPDTLNADQHRPFLRMLYQQCLNCFFRHAEVWLSFAHFELAQADAEDRLDKARAVLNEGLAAIPGNAMLVLQLAEIEDLDGAFETSARLLRDLFHHRPAGFTFAVYQRYIRKRLGVKAARRVFSETRLMRSTSDLLTIELYTATAELELDVNGEAQVALKILEAARVAVPRALQHWSYLQLIQSVLRQTGKNADLRCMLKTALAEAAEPIVPNALSLDRDQGAPFGENGYATQSIYWRLAPAQKLEVINHLLRMEAQYGGDLGEMQSLREDWKKAFNEQQGSEIRNQPREESTALAEASFEFFHRYADITICGLMEEEQELLERIQQTSYKEIGSANVAAEGSGGSSGGGGGGGGAKSGKGNKGISQAGIPNILRDFVNKLPKYVGLTPEIEQFCRHVRAVIIPPRPVDEEEGLPSGAVMDTAMDMAMDSGMEITAFSSSTMGMVDDIVDIYRDRRGQT